jgi:hypothetical protein
MMEIMTDVKGMKQKEATETLYCKNKTHRRKMNKNKERRNAQLEDK